MSFCDLSSHWNMERAYARIEAQFSFPLYLRRKQCIENGGNKQDRLKEENVNKSRLRRGMDTSELTHQNYKRKENCCFVYIFLVIY